MSDRLLSDEELYEAVERLKYSSSTKDTVDLINTQKKLYAASVIGEDEDPVHASAGSIARKNIIEYQNRLRAEQRASIYKQNADDFRRIK